jgi:erythrin-vacuolar iron transport family protein
LSAVDTTRRAVRRRSHRGESIAEGDNRQHRFALIAIRWWAILPFMTQAIAHLTRTLRPLRTGEPTLVLRYVQPGLVGLIDGTLSTLAPIFAAALLAGSRSALFVGLATALGAGISMGFSEALSDDGTQTGRGSGLARGLVTGSMTAFGGAFHSLPFLIPNVNTALLVAGIVVAFELTTISLIRKRFLSVSLRVSLLQVALGGAMIVGVGVALGSA